MKQKLLFTFLILFSFLGFSQKAKYEHKIINKKVQQPENLKNFKTYSYEIENDDFKWKFVPSDAYPTLTHAAGNLNFEGLTKVDNNPDLKIIAGFVGDPIEFRKVPKPSNPKEQTKIISLEGFFNILFLNKNNEVVLEYAQVDKVEDYYNAKTYPLKNQNETTITIARLVNKKVNRFLANYGHIFTGEIQLNLPFASFKKAKKGHAVEFNKKNKLYINKIYIDPENNAYLDAAISFWNKELNQDFGKVKDKYKYRVLYTNLTTAYILKGDYQKAQETYDELQKHKSMLSSLMSNDGGHLSALQRLQLPAEIVKKFKPYKIHNIHPKMVYYIKIPGEGYYLRNVDKYRSKYRPAKEIKLGKKTLIVNTPPRKKFNKKPFKDVFIQRIVRDRRKNLIEINGITNDKNYVAPVVFFHHSTLHDDRPNLKSYIHLDNAPDIYFKFVDRTLMPFIKVGDNYKLFEPVHSFRMEPK